MIKKWSEYIKESVKELSTTRADIEKRANELIDDHINDIFVELHQEFGTVSGDISPGQSFELTKLQQKIAKIMSDQVHSNLGEDITKVKTENLDMETLKSLSDERKDLKVGDRVIAVYFSGGFDAYLFTLEKPMSVVGLGASDGNTWYDVKDAYFIVKVETYNDFCDPKKRIPD